MVDLEQALVAYQKKLVQAQNSGDVFEAQKCALMIDKILKAVKGSK